MQTSVPLQFRPSEHDVPFGEATCRQPSVGSHESAVQTLLSLQFSVRQNFEQPSQLTGVPSVSHCSGYSMTPLPHAGHGSRQSGGTPGAVHVARARASAPASRGR
jgi:hypothetical protein